MGALASPPARSPARPGPAGWVRARFRQWWQARLPRSDTLVLTQRNVYILPTRPGLVFAVTLVVLLLASINYQLNLGYLLTFLLAGAGLVGMHLTHGTLRGLTLHLRSPGPVHAGEAAPLEVGLVDTAGRPRYGIGLRVYDDAARADAGWTWTDVPPRGQAVAHVSFQPLHRGWHDVPPLTAETRFPLGIFRVWAVWRPAARLLAYPAPEVHPPPLPPAQAIPGGAAQARSREGGETDGVRAYRRGDPLKLVVWKKAAKTDELVSRDTASAARHELWLDYQLAGGADPEARLSRMAAWVIEADRAELRYGLRLPGEEIPPDQGELHRRQCLERLALWS